MNESEQLIGAVKEKPCLWNPHDQFYTRKEAKVTAWHEIASALLPEYDNCDETEKQNKRDEFKRRWNNIKDNYRKDCLKRLSGSSKRSYLYAEALSFLDDIMKLNRQSSVSSGMKNENDDNNDEDSDNSYGNNKEKDLVKQFTKKNSIKFIKCVEENPCLWDKTSFCKEKRDRALDNIATKMEPNYKSFNKTQKHSYRLALLKRWFNIRDAYRKNMKALASGRNMRPYRFFKYLEFLDAIYDYERKVEYNDDDDNEENYEEDDDMQVYESDSNHQIEAGDLSNNLFVDVNETDTIAKIAKTASDANHINNSNDLHTILAAIAKTNADEDLAFFKSLLPDVKMLSPSTKLDFKIKVLKMLKTLQRSDVLSVKLEEDSDRNSDI